MNDEAADPYFFGELEDVYRAERLRNNENDENDNDYQFKRRAERVIDTVMAEVTLYQNEPSLPLQDADGKFSCPLQWWKNCKKSIRLSPSWLYVYYAFLPLQLLPNASFLLQA